MKGYLFIVVTLILSLAFISAVPTVTINPTNITVSGTGELNISWLNSTVNNAGNMTMISAGIYELYVPVYITSATVNTTLSNADVNWLRLNGSSTIAMTTSSSPSVFIINNTKISSWDGTDYKYTNSNRASLTLSGSRIYVNNATFLYLGNATWTTPSSSYGVIFNGGGAASYIKNSNFTGNYMGIHIASSGMNVANISGNYFYNNTYNDIYMSLTGAGSKNITIENNQFIDPRTSGTSKHGGIEMLSQTSNSSGLIIKNNNFTLFNSTINGGMLLQGNNFSVYDNIIKGSDKLYEFGITLRNLSNSSIYNNKLSNTQYEIYVIDSYNLSISNNTLYDADIGSQCRQSNYIYWDNNTFKNITMDYDGYNVGLLVYNTSNTYIRWNNFLELATVGVVTQGSYNTTIEGNYFNFIPLNQYTLPNRMVGWWRLNSNGESQVDSSGFGNTGTASASWTSSGKVEGGFDFNGSSVANTINISSKSYFSPANNGNQLSVSLWIKPNSFNFTGGSETSTYDSVHFLGKDNPDSKREWYFRLYNGTGVGGTRAKRISFYVFNNTNPTGIGSYFQDDLVEGEWIHIVGVINSTHTQIWKNGVLRDSDNWTSLSPLTATDEPIFIGKHFDYYVTDPSSFNGTIDEVVIYNYSLNSSEIKEIYYATINNRTNYNANDGYEPRCAIQATKRYKGYFNQFGNDGFFINSNTFDSSVPCYLHAENITTLSHDFTSYWYRKFTPNMSFAGPFEFFIPNNYNNLSWYHESSGLTKYNLRISDGNRDTNLYIEFNISQNYSFFKNINTTNSFSIILSNLSHAKSNYSNGTNVCTSCSGEYTTTLNSLDNLSVYYEYTNPLITIVNPDTGEETANPVVFSLTTNEVSSCNYSLNSGANNSMTTSDYFSFLSSSTLTDGGYNLLFSCEDEYGNTASASTSFRKSTISSYLGSSTSDIESTTTNITNQTLQPLKTLESQTKTDLLIDNIKKNLDWIYHQSWFYIVLGILIVVGLIYFGNKY